MTCFLEALNKVTSVEKMGYEGDADIMFQRPGLQNFEGQDALRGLCDARPPQRCRSFNTGS